MKLPQPPKAGPFRKEFWRSPLRGRWLTSILGSALLPLIVICFVTGLLSHIAYNPGLAGNSPLGPDRGLDLHPFDWPTSPAWLFALVQGLHVTSGLAAIPLLLAKLWSVIPKLFEHPPVRSAAHGIERVSQALLVGGGLFVLFTGVLNIQLYYPWKFSFVPAHYYAAFIFIAALTFHLTLKIPVVRRTIRREGIKAPLERDREHTIPQPRNPNLTVSPDPGPVTISRRLALATIGGTSLALALMGAGQSIGGPFRRLALLAPRGQKYGSGPNAFPVNKTAAYRGIKPAMTGPSWRLQLKGARSASLSRDQLLGMPQHSEHLPIACVEGWSTTQHWSGVRLRDLAELAGMADAGQLLTQSLQNGGAFASARLARNQLTDPRSLLALRVNGVDLSLDHGFPARLIVPALPGVHCTKWVSAMTFEA